MAWGNAETQIEHEAMEAIRPYSVLFRKGPAGWVFVDVGPEFRLCEVVRLDLVQSAIGKLMNEDDVGDEFNEFIAGAYSRIYHEGGVRLRSPIRLRVEGRWRSSAGTFQRLLLGCVFPDGTPGLIVLAVITRQVEIDALDPAEDIPDLPQPN